MKKYKVVIIILAALLVLESIFLAYLLLRRPKKVAPPVVAPAIRGRIAIVLDDWGYNTRNFAILDNIKYPVTFAVLPNLRYSTLASQELAVAALRLSCTYPWSRARNSASKKAQS